MPKHSIHEPPPPPVSNDTQPRDWGGNTCSITQSHAALLDTVHSKPKTLPGVLHLAPALSCIIGLPNNMAAAGKHSAMATASTALYNDIVTFHRTVQSTSTTPFHHLQSCPKNQALRPSDFQPLSWIRPIAPSIGTSLWRTQLQGNEMQC